MKKHILRTGKKHEEVDRQVGFRMFLGLREYEIRSNPY